jgi:hypothetical protein
MAAKSYHLVANGVLESQYDANCNNHYCQPDGYAYGGNADSWTAYLMVVALSKIDSTS